VVLIAGTAVLVCFSIERVCAVVFRSCLATGPGAARGRYSCSGPAPRDELSANCWIEPRASLRQLSSGTEPRARWSGREASRLLLGLLVARLGSEGPLVLGIDDTIERRRGKRIQAQGIYRDPVRRSRSHFVKASGLRWVSLMLLAPVPWAARPWALPFLTGLAPSERYAQKGRKRHKPVLDWARQMIFQTQRGLPHRDLVVVADSAFSALQWLHTLVQKRITVVTRLRWEAALYEPAPFRPPGTNGRPRKKGKRLPT
jgi:DDE superfamily endonuclease